MGERGRAAVLGAGFGGQGMAAYLVLKGYSVQLWNRPHEDEARRWLAPIRETGAIEACGWWSGRAPIDVVTTDIAEAMHGVSLVAVTATADAHRAIARLAEGRTMERLGLAGLDLAGLKQRVRGG